MLKCCIKDCDCEADYIIKGFSLCEGHVEEKPTYGEVLYQLVKAGSVLCR